MSNQETLGRHTGHGTPGKVMEIKNSYSQAWIKSQKFLKSHGNVLYSYVNLRSLIKRINIYINMYSFILTIVSHFCHLKLYTCIH